MEQKDIMLIPTPKKATDKGEKIALAPYICCERKEWKELISVFCDCAEKIQGLTFTEGAGGVELCFDDRLKRESYTLETYASEEGNCVRVSAPDYQGAAYGLASVLQLLDRE